MRVCRTQDTSNQLYLYYRIISNRVLSSIRGCTFKYQPEPKVGKLIGISFPVPDDLNYSIRISWCTLLFTFPNFSSLYSLYNVLKGMLKCNQSVILILCCLHSKTHNYRRNNQVTNCQTRKGTGHLYSSNKRELKRKAKEY